MTRRRDRNRDARRALAFAASYTCPDCHADKRLSEQAPGVYLLDVAHDETCPAYRAMSPPCPVHGRACGSWHSRDW
jgi:hypothetical protein